MYAEMYNANKKLWYMFNIWCIWYGFGYV